MADIAIGRNGALAPIETPQPRGQHEGAVEMVGRAKTASDGETRWKDPIHVVRELGCLGLLGMCLAWGGPKLFEERQDREKIEDRLESCLQDIKQSIAQSERFMAQGAENSKRISEDIRAMRKEREASQ